MTKERIAAIADVLASDDNLRKELLEMEPEAAVKVLLEKGYVFTADELGEFGRLVVDAQAEGELSAEDLENVAGGGVTIITLLGVTFVTKVAYDVGKAIGNRWW